MSLFVLFNSLRIFRYKSKFQELSEEDFIVEAKHLICSTCNISLDYPQHHGREMIKIEDHLICWKNIAAEIDADKCSEETLLYCPKCNGTLEIQ